MSFICCLMGDVLQQTYDVRCLMSDVWCLLSDFRHLMSRVKLLMSHFGRLRLDVWCMISDADVRLLMSRVRRLMVLVWCQMSDICCLMSDIWYQSSEFHCLMSDVRRLLSDVDMSDVRHDVRCLMCDVFVVWCQAFAVIGNTRIFHTLVQTGKLLSPADKQNYCLHCENPGALAADVDIYFNIYTWLQ